jgi:hypothetical protein
MDVVQSSENCYAAWISMLANPYVLCWLLRSTIPQISMDPAKSGCWKNTFQVFFQGRAVNFGEANPNDCPSKWLSQVSQVSQLSQVSQVFIPGGCSVPISGPKDRRRSLRTAWMFWPGAEPWWPLGYEANEMRVFMDQLGVWWTKMGTRPRNVCMCMSYIYNICR